MKYIYSILLCFTFISCQTGNQKNDLTSKPNPEWKSASLSANWSLYVPKNAVIVFRHSSLLSEPDEILFTNDSLRVEFCSYELGYEPETTDFTMIARDVIKDPTLGLCQGDGSGEGDIFPVIDYAKELSGFRSEGIDKGERSIGLYVRQMKFKKRLLVVFRFVNDKNVSLVDSIIRTIECRNTTVRDL